MSAETEIWFEIEIKDGADLDYFLWKSIQSKIRKLETDLYKVARKTEERTPPFNYLLKVRFTLTDLSQYKKFLAARNEARELSTPKEFHASITEAETRRLGR